MTASNTDLLKKYLSLFSTTLSTGIGTGTGDTITPASVSGLATDTAVTLTIDRVDSGGVATPIKMERIKGVISGGNLTSYVRGVDGTTEQAHSAGAVVEMVWNSDDWNNMVDWGLVSHNQDGSIGASKVVASNISASAVTAGKLAASSVVAGNLAASVMASASEVATGTEDAKIVTPKAIKDAGIVALTKAAGSDITTGTDDAKFATAKALADAGVNTRLKTKVKQISRDLTATGGQVSYTGVGFTPSAIISLAGLGADVTSIGVADSAKGGLLLSGGPTWATNTGTVGANLGLYGSSGGNYQTWNVYSYDADGFTLTWSKTGSPTGTLYISFLCFG